CLYNEGPDWYVAEDGDDVNNDGSEAFPFATIQKAIDMGQGDGTDIIHIGSGTFTENVSIENKHLTIIGQGPENTIIDGGGISRVIRLYGRGTNGKLNISISELSLVNGSGEEDGGAIYAEDINLLLDHIIITDNYANETGPAIYAEWCDFIIRNSLIYNNENISDDVGGLYLAYTNGLIENSTIVDNEATSIQLAIAKLWLVNSIIEINYDTGVLTTGGAELYLAYTNIVSQSGMEISGPDDIESWDQQPYGTAHYLEGVTNYPIAFTDDYQLESGSYGIDAGISTFAFEEDDDWSDTWSAYEQDAFEYDYFENHDSFSGSAPDIGWTESEYIGVPFCDDLLSSNYESEGTYLDCEYNHNYAIKFDPDD
ncbi:uncharacterized protein METZ01_LOCUS311801, partial [marine metagenome]